MDATSGATLAMAGLYLHIPFCKQKCHYCSFHFSTTYEAYRERMLSSLELEIVEYAKQYKEEIATVYFGGGTPSLLAASELQSILQLINSNYRLIPAAEITLEANPDDITKEKAKQWLDMGINRLSIGIQSFKEDDLKCMNRAHNSKEAASAIQTIKDAGFKNYSVDLMFGLPSQSNREWKKNLNALLAFKPPHISCYNLTLEEQTALIKLIEQKKIQGLKEQDAEEQFIITRSFLMDASYEHYEISNYAIDGFESKHNKAYWEGKNYLGIGPSAHSYWNGKRWANVANNSQYMKGLEQGKPDRVIEELSKEEALNEYLLTRLRTKQGVDVHELEQLHPWAMDSLEKTAKKLSNEGLLNLGDQWQLSPKGQLLADQVSMEFFQ